MQATPYYHESVKKLVSALGTLLNNMRVKRVNNGVCSTVADSNIVTITDGTKTEDTMVGQTIIIRGVNKGNQNFATTITAISTTTLALAANVPQTKANAPFKIDHAIIKVPVSYAPHENYLRRITEDKSLETIQTQIVLPRLSFELVSMSYDSSRKLNQLQTIVEADQADQTRRKYQYQRVPYNFDFTVYIYVRNLDDGYQIVEQILPFFQPEFTVTINDTSDMNIKTDVPFILSAVSQDDRYEGLVEQTRLIIYSLNITAKGYIYCPTKFQGLITKVITNIYTSNWTQEYLRDAKLSETITIEPDTIVVQDEPTGLLLYEHLYLYQDGDNTYTTEEESPIVAKVFEINDNTITIKMLDYRDKFKSGQVLKSAQSGLTLNIVQYNESIQIELF